MKRLRLHLRRIEDELRDVQRHFPAINAVLNCRRDDFSDTVLQNMLAAYEFLDAVVADKLDLFGDEGLEALLQLNHLVLLGRGYDLRAFDRHITVTRGQFFENFRRYVKPIQRWYRKHETENPYKVAGDSWLPLQPRPCRLKPLYLSSGIALQRSSTRPQPRSARPVLQAGPHRQRDEARWMPCSFSNAQSAKQNFIFGNVSLLR